MATKKFYDLSTLLQVGNILIGLAAIILYGAFGTSEYVNIYTIYLAGFLSLQNIVMLAYEKHRRDPFIQIMLAVTTLFYTTRILSLLYDPWSLVLMRYPFEASDLNYSIVFIAAANISIFFGLRTAGANTPIKKFTDATSRPGKIGRVVLIFVTTILTNFFFIQSIESLGRLSSFIAGVFLFTYAILLMTMVFLVVNYDALSRINKKAIFTLFIIFIIVVTVFGSRSSFLTVATLAVCSALSVHGQIKISRGSIGVGLLLIPVVILSFLIATFVRELNYDPKTRIDIKRLEFIKNFKLADAELEPKTILRPLFDRIGYLTYAAEIISNGKKYSEVINFGYYAMSVVDNALTPGFNIFNTPKAANALRYIYLDIKPNPTHEDVVDNYNSDIFTVYGEYHVLFGGIAAQVFFFITAYIFKKLYCWIKINEKYLFYLFRSLLLLLFCNWLISFGLDWMIVEVISYLVPILIWSRFFKMRKNLNPIAKRFKSHDITSQTIPI